MWAFGLPSCVSIWHHFTCMFTLLVGDDMCVPSDRKMCILCELLWSCWSLFWHLNLPNFRLLGCAYVFLSLFERVQVFLVFSPYLCIFAFLVGLLEILYSCLQLETVAFFTTVTHLLISWMFSLFANSRLLLCAYEYILFIIICFDFPFAVPFVAECTKG